MQRFVKRINLLTTPIHDSPGLWLLIVIWRSLLTSVCDSNRHEELCDLVSVLGRCWYFDGTWPIKIVMAESIAKLLNLQFGQAWLILWDVKMSWLDASLSGCGWSHVEIKFLISLFISHHKSTINDAPTWRISELPLGIFHKESLIDSFVHNNECDLRQLVYDSVRFGDSFLKLWDFPVKDLLSLGITNSISVYDEIGWKHAFVILLTLEGVDSTLEGLLHLSLNYLLAFFLNQILAVVLTHTLVDGSSKTHNRFWSCMANIDSNEHGPEGIHHFREFHLVKISSTFDIDLLENVACLWQIEWPSISSRDDLWWDLVLLEKLLVHRIIALVAENRDNYHWMAEDAIFRSHHVVKESLFKSVVVCFIFKLKPIWFLNSDIELSAGFLERWEDLFRFFATAVSTVAEDPFLSLELNRCLDLKPS